jgi:hypothetical protein
VDYLAINCSSPNTPEVATVPFEQITAIPHRRPLYLKINPEQIEAAIAAEPDGLILCNTDQGVSGPDLLGRTIRAVRHARSLTTLPIIGCGGIWSKEAAGCVLEAGASEVQVLTSWLLGGFRPMTEQKDEWTDTSQKPEDEFQYLKLRCSDGKDRYGYGTRWPDNTWAGWIIDETGDFIDGVLADYEVTGWMPADIPEPAMEMPA